MLHAVVHSGCESERAMLANALDKLTPGDVLLLDRGYPGVWLINLLNEQGILFVMLCDTASGDWRAVREFMRGYQPEAVVTLSAPDARDAADWACSAQAGIGARMPIQNMLAPMLIRSASTVVLNR